MAQEERPSVFRESDVDNALDKVDVSRIAAGVRRRLWIPVVCGILFALGFGILSHHLLQKFNAEVLLLYRKENRHLDVPGMKHGYTLSHFSLPTLVDMVQLADHYKAVKSILGLENSGADIQSMVRVEVPNRQADIIRILCTADSPGIAVDVVNTLASVAVKHSQSIRTNQLQVAKDYFSHQVDVSQDRLSRHLSEIAEFKKDHDFLELRTDGLGTLRGLETAEERLRESKLKYESLLVEYENLRREINKIPDHIVKEAYEDDPIKQRVSHTELALLHARTRYADDNPKVKVLEEELDQLRRMITEGGFEETTERVYVKNQMKEGLNIELVRLQGKLRSSQKLKEEAELVLMQMQQELTSLPEEQMTFVRLLHKKTMYEEQLRNSEEAIRSTDLLMSLGRGDLELYQLAEDASPNESKLIKFLPIAGLGVGLALGLVAAFLLEVADRKIRTGKEVSLNYTSPCLQVIPELSRLNARTADRKMLFFTRNISDRLSYAHGDEGYRTLLVTSGVAGEGKSTVALQLAKYHQRLGKKVLYLEFDHQPNIYLEHPTSQKCVNDYLSGRASLDDIIQPGEIDRIFTRYSEDMKELVGSHASEKLFQGLQQRYDLIVVDAPGVIDDDYTVNLCHGVDVVLFVIGSSRVKKSLVDIALVELNDNGIIPTGLVLNRIKSSYCNDPRLSAEKKRQRRQWLRGWKKETPSQEAGA